jgi:hypothetical protein
MCQARIFNLIVLLMLCATGVCQQSLPNGSPLPAGRDGRIRFRGGLINVSSGNVSCLFRGIATPARAGDTLHNGEVIEIDKGRAEILLNPGYYLRLADQTQVEFVDLSPGNLKIRLLRGSAIVEIAIDTWPELFYLKEWKERLFKVLTVNTPRDEFVVAAAGAFRFDVNSNGRTEISVTHGWLALPGHMIKDGTRASVYSGRIEPSAVDAKSRDDFDVWSRERAAALIKSNNSLKERPWFKELEQTALDLADREPDAATQSIASYTVSARAGIIEFSESGTQIKHSSSNWQDLNTGDSLSDGDRLRTIANGRAEIRPYPLYYLFLGGNTEIGYAESEEGEVTIRVFKGTVVVDVPKTNETLGVVTDLALLADNVEYHIQGYGYYRLNVSAANSSEMIVRYGAVKSPTQQVKAPRKIEFNESGARIVPFDRKMYDSFDIWSDHRVARYVMSRTAYLRKIWSAAAWVFDETTNEFTLVPGGLPYKSPYGGKYSVVFSLAPQPIRRPTPKKN